MADFDNIYPELQLRTPQMSSVTPTACVAVHMAKRIAPRSKLPHYNSEHNIL